MLHIVKIKKVEGNIGNIINIILTPRIRNAATNANISKTFYFFSVYN